jgi:hypothetical protein
LLLHIVIKLRAIFPFEEEEMNLTVIVSHHALGRMAQKSCQSRQTPYPDAPLDVCSGNQLPLHAKTQGNIDGDKPYIPGCSVEHTTHQCLLTGQTRHLPIGRIAEIGKHQQDYSQYVVCQVGIVEHPARSYTEEYRQHGDDVRMNAKFVPQQCKNKSYGSGEMYIQPLFCIVGLEGSL